MFNMFLFISGAEIAFIIFIGVMVFGADKIPEIARGIGKGMRTLKNATNDIKHEITKNVEDGKKGRSEAVKNVKEEIDKIKEDVEQFTGSIKRNK